MDQVHTQPRRRVPAVTAASTAFNNLSALSTRSPPRPSPLREGHLALRTPMSRPTRRTRGPRPRRVTTLTMASPAPMG
ncbi:uncharacterized protein PHACADRAFT_264147 [Phanerochaete carnosa HHB-10118-sp]|uniref:Uncharacterized protein n=1 Tax=Phanerochaete carnosa (strain HHB-10118-sp) TaxID=650164 RepID=K5VHJ1_PHACS|nr:uncharacterized protein PHACADRAFT_264147 [Phanerochaete carnosa HHB-10118-sp]EKM50713.1 hypothetical protein PHACADRAFT_264147 [Phanerochaete carnosa HHB-10118-sp]